MLRLLVGFFTLIFSLASCGTGTGEPDGQHPGPGAEVAQSKPCKTLIVVGDDRSGSATEIRRLDSADYIHIMETICEKGGGAFACVIIGNPNPQHKQSFRATFDLPLAHKQKKPGATLSEDEQVMLENKRIDGENVRIKEANAGRVLDFYKVLSENVIHYKPDNKDLTDLNDALNHVQTIINEPTYTDYDHIIVALFSDGVNQPKGSKIEPITVKLESAKDFRLYTIGWKDNSIFSGIKNKASFDSKDGFMETIKQISCH